MYEFASLDRPVVVMNAPWYQDEPDDGIRFWKEIPGIQVWQPQELENAVKIALRDPKDLRAQRHAAVENVYPVRGNSADSAVAAIKQFAKEAPLMDFPQPKHSGEIKRRDRQHQLRDRVTASLRFGKSKMMLPIEQDVRDVTKERDRAVTER